MSIQIAPVTADEMAPRRVKVWDAFVRLFHWSTAVAFFVAYFSEDDVLSVHVWAGYTIGALVVLRIAWGFVGPEHARFSDFVTGPWKALRYLLDLIAGRAERHLGHSPAGGVMVLLLLAGTLATVWSGMELHAAENNAGPLAAVAAPGETASAPANALTFIAVARADEDEREERYKGSDRGDEGPWEEIHEILANGVMAMVVLHVLGVLLASVVHRENLVASMIDGKKRGERTPR